MEALLTGAGGWFAKHFLLEALRLGWPLYVSHRGQPAAFYPANRQFFLDLTQPSTFAELDKHRPAVIIHAAAVSKPLACERDRRLAWRVNVEGTAALLEHAARWDGKVILLSTDQVFDGAAEEYTEESVPCPINFYGFTKAEAEKLVLQAGGTVARLSLMFGSGSPLWEDLVSALRTGQTMTLFHDLVRTPTWVGDVVRVLGILAFGERYVGGVWHIVGPQSVDRYTWGQIVAEAMGCDPRVLQPIPYPVSAEIHVPLRIQMRSHRRQEEMNLQCHGLTEGTRLALAVRSPSTTLQLHRQGGYCYGQS